MKPYMTDNELFSFLFVIMVNHVDFITILLFICDN